MKILPLLAAVAGLALTSASASYAAIARSVPHDASTISPPKPLQIVKPTDLPRRFIDATIQLRMTITPEGRAVDVTGVGALPDDLAKQLIPAVERWTFTPATRDGKPMAMEIILPLKLIDRSL